MISFYKVVRNKTFNYRYDWLQICSQQAPQLNALITAQLDLSAKMAWTFYLRPLLHVSNNLVPLFAPFTNVLRSFSFKHWYFHNLNLFIVIHTARNVIVNMSVTNRSILSAVPNAAHELTTETSSHRLYYVIIRCFTWAIREVGQKSSGETFVKCVVC